MIPQTIVLIALTAVMSFEIRADGSPLFTGRGARDFEVGRPDTIFIGRVVSVRLGGPDPDPNIGIHYDEEVKVLKVLRGFVGQNVLLNPAYSPNAAPPRAGDTFIFYAQKNVAGWFPFTILKIRPAPKAS